MTLEEAEKILQRYMRSTEPLEVLGFGIDGFVWSTWNPTAIKVFERSIPFQRELAVYERLLECDVTSICGFSVPKLVNFDRELMVVEMTVVQPPFLLDFAKATVDVEMGYPEEVMEQEWARVREVFGERFGVVQDVYFELAEKYGIYYYDFTPRNLNFGD